jgi:hypothetical protein
MNACAIATRACSHRLAVLLVSHTQTPRDHNLARLALDVTAAVTTFACACGLAVIDDGSRGDAAVEPRRGNMHAHLPTSSEDVPTGATEPYELEFEPSDFSGSSDDETRERAVAGFYMHAVSP